MNTTQILVMIISSLVSFLIGYWIKSGIDSKSTSSNNIALKDLQQSQKELQIRNKELNIELSSLKNAISNESKVQNEKKIILSELEQRLNDREKQLLKRGEILDSRYETLQKKEDDIDIKLKDIEKSKDNLSKQLYTIASLSKEEAEEIVKRNAETNLANWMAKTIKDKKSQLDIECEQISQDILVDAMLNASTDYISDVAVTRFQLKSDDQKGKIIGKEGRNIKTLEKLTGVEILVDEDNTSISISCFDPIRREVAAITLARLLKDGRMHPGTIEETVEKVKKDLLKIIKKEGTELAYEAGFTNMPEEIIKLIGKFKYRFSYGQNLARHTLEVIRIAESIAKDLKADVKVVKLAALMHDIGKVVITDSLGSENKQHHHISGEIAKKYNMPDKVVNAIEAHHEDVESNCIEAEIVKIADKISGSRIGARRESYEDYIKRITELEDIAYSFKGVKECFAIYAGREIRVIVSPDKISDDQCVVLSQNIANRIHNTQNYPGIIKITVIREKRAIANA